MVSFDVVKLLFETVTPLFKRMEGGARVLMNSINGRLQTVSFFS